MNIAIGCNVNLYCIYSLRSMREALIQSLVCCTICRCLNLSSMQFLLSRGECGALCLMNEIFMRVIIIIVVLPTNFWTYHKVTERRKKCFLNLIFGKLISRWMLEAMKFHFAASRLFVEPQLLTRIWRHCTEYRGGITVSRHFLKHLFCSLNATAGTTHECSFLCLR